MILLADRSGSMEAPEPPTAPSSKFALMTKALTGLLTATPSRDVVAGLVWLPQPPPLSTAAQCLPPSYETFAVAPGVVGDGVGAAISSALAAGVPGGPSAWSPALRGATKLALQEAVAHPERAVSVLMVADDVPTGCGVTEATPFVIPPEIAAATATGQLRVFVMGLSAGGAQVKALDDQIATAGGTTAAYLPNLLDAATLDLALATVRERASCVVNLPSAFDERGIFGCHRVVAPSSRR